MKFQISFWSKGEDWEVIIDTNKCRLDEILICLDEQYKV